MGTGAVCSAALCESFAFFAVKQNQTAKFAKQDAKVRKETRLQYSTCLSAGALQISGACFRHKHKLLPPALRQLLLKARVEVEVGVGSLRDLPPLDCARRQQ